MTKFLFKNGLIKKFKNAPKNAFKNYILFYKA